MSTRTRAAAVGGEFAAVFAVAVWVAARNLEGLGAAGGPVPVGPDAGMWGLAGLDVAHGNVCTVPPLFPALLALVGGGEAGLRVSALAAALVPAVVYAGVRAAGGGVAGAMVAAACCLGSTDLYGFALQLQPEATTALAFALGAAALAVYGARRSWGAAAGLCAVVPLAVLAREHGIVVACTGALALLLWPPAGVRGARRWVAPAALGLVLAVVPVLAGLGTAPPWAWPWGGKGEVPLRDLAAIWEAPQTERPAYVRESVVEEAGPGIDRPAAAAVVATYPRALALPDRGERVLLVLRLNAWWAWAIGAGVYRFLGLGLLGFGIAAALRHKPSLLAPAGLLAAVLPLWIVWSQRRHVAVLLPVGALGLGLGWSALWDWLETHRPRRIPSWALGIAGMVLAAAVSGVGIRAGIADSARWARFLRGQADRDRELVALGKALGQRAEPGDALCADPSFLSSVQLFQLSAGLPYQALGPSLLSKELSAGDAGWRCYLVVRPAILQQLQVAPGWERVLDPPNRAVFRYKPGMTGEDRARLEPQDRLRFQGAR